MKRLTLILILALSLMLLALSSIGCGTTEVVNDNKATTTSTPATPVVAQPAASTAAPAGVANTGVASCDEYLTKIDDCLNNKKMLEAAKGPWRQSLEANRSAWRVASSTPEGRAKLDASCKAALESAKGFLATCK